MPYPRPCRLLPALLIALAILAPTTPGWPMPELAAQDTTSPDADEAAVRTALEHYLQGHATGESAHFRTAFHEVADLYWVADGALQTRTGDDYVAGAPGRPAANEAERRRRIAWIEVAGDAAVARIELDYPGVFIVDYMSLLRTDGEWRIVNKIFHVDRSGSLGPAGGEPGTAGAAEVDPREAAEEIGQASRAFSRAYVAGDTATLRALYTEDALLLPPEGEVRGREAIVRYFGPRSDRRNVAHAMTSAELTITGATATDVGTWSHTAQVEGQPAREASGRYLVVWRRGADGRWRIEYDMWHRPWKG